MKALVLVGGFGTRLRPLTLSYPKPLIEFCNRAILVHQIEALIQVGVDEVVLAVNFQPKVMESVLEKIQERYPIKITCSHESEALGTAGPLALASSLLDSDEPFFVLNSDIICDYPLQQMLIFHKTHGEEGTILATRVEEPSKYGVVVSDEETGQVLHFVEKPTQFFGNAVNAGVYLFNREVLDRIKAEPMSIEEQIFPQMAAEHHLFCIFTSNYWVDVGKPKDYLSGMILHLDLLRQTKPEALATGQQFIGNVLVDSTATIGEGCLIGPDVVIGPDCVIGNGVRLCCSTLFRGVTVRENSWVASCLIGWQSTVGRWCRIEAMTVIGEDVQITDERYINGALILPHKTISTNIVEPGTIVM